MQQTKKKKTWCTSRGPHVLKLANVTTKPCPMWPHYISYATKLRAKLFRSLHLSQIVVLRAHHVRTVCALRGHCVHTAHAEAVILTQEYLSPDWLHSEGAKPTRQ